MHPGADAVSFPFDRDRVVEVLGRVGVDREGGQAAQVGAPVEARFAQLERLERRSRSPFGQEPLEHGFDPIGRPEHALHLRPSSAAGDDREVAALGAVQRLAVEDDRRTGEEVRLADDELPRLPTSTTIRTGSIAPTLSTSVRGTPAHHPLRA